MPGESPRTRFSRSRRLGEGQGRHREVGGLEEVRSQSAGRRTGTRGIGFAFSKRVSGRGGMKVTIFFSWQSDTKAAANRTLIQAALEAAARDLRQDDSIAVEPVVDRDTLAVPGSPDIGATILQKIESSAAIVADVTIINSEDIQRPTPNPNVLIELGYALKSLGESRIVLVQNTAYGGPELLPFDLRQKRALTYNSPADAESRVDERRKLHAGLREALALILVGSRCSTHLYP